jgi:hypothetical protein
VSHAEPEGQSATVVQPQLPPVAAAMQLAPMLLVVQSTQAPPTAPHAVCAVPCVQAPAAQQPPLHALKVSPPSPPPQAAPQRWVERSQAVPMGQSLAPAQPQAPPTHA